MINIVNSKTTAPQKWFTYPASPDEQYLLRYIPANSLPSADVLTFNEQALQRALVDWRGVIGENDAPIECTQETRLAFLRDPSGATEDRLKWIFDIVFVREKFSDADGILKNSPAPSPGALTSQKQLLAAA